MTSTPTSARAVEQPLGAPPPWPAVALFLVVSFGLAWALALPLWLGEGLATPSKSVLLPVIMFTPAVGALAALVATRHTRQHSAWRLLGITPIRPVRRVIGWAVVGLFGSVLIACLSVLLSAATGVIRLDLAEFSGYRQLLDGQLATAGAGDLPAPVGLLVLAQLLLIPVAAVVNGVLAFGEEVGWRGWLLPALLPLGPWPALLLTGVVWGLWHAPVILLGYNFGEPNALGMLYMTLGCTAYGVLVGWLRLRSRSLWPAVLAHGAFNASAGIGLLVLAADSDRSPVSVLPLGWPGWVVCAVIAVVVAIHPRTTLRTDASSAADARST